MLSPVPAGAASSTISFMHAGIAAGSGSGSDPSGNVWVANNTVTASTNDTSSIFEIVGAAAPAVTPLAAQFNNSGAGLGAKP